MPKRKHVNLILRAEGPLREEEEEWVKKFNEEGIPFRDLKKAWAPNISFPDLSLVLAFRETLKELGYEVEDPVKIRKLFRNVGPESKLNELLKEENTRKAQKEYNKLHKLFLYLIPTNRPQER